MAQWSIKLSKQIYGKFDIEFLTKVCAIAFKINALNIFVGYDNSLNLRYKFFLQIISYSY